jgi:hypothetical protein
MKMTNNKKGVLRMKKFLGLFLVLALAGFAFAANTTTAYVNSETASMAPNHSPNDVVVLNLYTKASVASKDTFATGDIHIQGPFPLSSSNGTGMFGGLQVVGDVITGTTPVMAVDMQILPTGNIADTVANWTSLDTLGPTTATNHYHSLAAYSGKYILFRVNNYDNSASQIPGNLRILFRENWSFQMRR